MQCRTAAGRLWSLPRQRPHKLRPIPISQFPIIPLSLFCQCQKRPADTRRALLVYRDKNRSFSICKSLSPWERCHCKAMTERVSPARQSHCTAIGRLFVRAKRSPHPCLSVSILALSGAPRQTPLFVAYATSSPGRGKSFLKGRAFSGGIIRSSLPPPPHGSRARKSSRCRRRRGRG